MADQRRGLVVAALMLTTGLAAIDATIVATAVPQIVHDLGGFAKFPWLFSLYLLTQSVLVPIYGRLADVFGRKPMLLFGIGVFLVASVLCGAAWSMVSLIAFRGLQGIGAGAIIPMTTTIVADLYEPVDRGRIQGYISGVWGVTAIVGPTVGGLFAEYLSWRGIFFVNIPIGLGALWMLQLHLREDVARRAHRIDLAGAVVLTLGLSALILALLEGGVSWSWTSAQSIALFAAAGALLVAFPPIERSAAEPILPLWVLRPRILVSTNLAGFVIGAILIGLTSYVPTFAQRVVGVGAVVAGLALGAMTVGWPIAATLSPRVYLRLGYRRTALLGGVFASMGCLLFALLVDASSIWRIAVASFVTGFGLGFSSVSTVVSAQSVVGWERRGVVTGTNMFIRSLGSAVGVAVFGSIVNSELHGGATLYHAIHVVFWVLVGVAFLGLAAQLTMPKRVEPLVFDDEGAGYARAGLPSTPARPATSRARS
ncbi:MAG TPA: MDR family MFS transporter [Gaiellaceae bacterium]|jgi:EmrB/QacA subfamily drug resistance transporter